MKQFQQLIDSNNWDEVLKVLPTSSEDDRVLVCNYFLGNYHNIYDRDAMIKLFDWICPVKLVDSTFDQYILHFAIEKADIEMIQKIVEERPNVLGTNGAFGRFEYLTCAVQNFTENKNLNHSQCVAVLKELLVHFKDNNCSALSEAIRNNIPKVFDMILPHSNLRANHSLVLLKVLLEDKVQEIKMILDQDQCLFAEALYSLKFGDIRGYVAEHTQENINNTEGLLEQLITQEHSSTLQNMACQMWKCVTQQNVKTSTQWLNTCSDQALIYMFARMALNFNNADLAMPFLAKLEVLESDVGSKMRNIVSHEDFVSLIPKMSSETRNKIFCSCIYSNDFYYATFLNNHGNLTRTHQDVLENLTRMKNIFKNHSLDGHDYVDRFQLWMAQWENDTITSSIDSLGTTHVKKKI